jgi:hypothetical protein
MAAPDHNFAAAAEKRLQVICDMETFCCQTMKAGLPDRRTKIKNPSWVVRRIALELMHTKGGDN